MMENPPELAQTIGLIDAVAYAGATWDWHRLHYDPAYTAERGLDSPVVDGQMLGALLARQVLDHLGPSAFLRTLDFRLKSMVSVGETVRCTAETASSEETDGGVLVTFDQRMMVEDRSIIDGARAQVFVPSAAPRALLNRLDGHSGRGGAGNGAPAEPGAVKRL